MSGLLESAIAAADAQADIDDKRRVRMDAAEMLYGRVLAVGDDGTLDLSINGDTVPGVRMTTACAGVQVGDSVIVTKFGAKRIATGVLARDNRHYVERYALYRQPDKPDRGISLVASGSLGLVIFDMQQNLPKDVFTYYATLPDGIRPALPDSGYAGAGGIYGTINTSQGTNPAAIRTFISADGRVGLYCGDIDAYNLVGTMAFIIA